MSKFTLSCLRKNLFRLASCFLPSASHVKLFFVLYLPGTHSARALTLKVMMRLREKGEMKTGRQNERGNGLDNRRFLVERGSLFYFILFYLSYCTRVRTRDLEMQTAYLIGSEFTAQFSRNTISKVSSNDRVVTKVSPTSPVHAYCNRSQPVLKLSVRRFSLRAQSKWDVIFIASFIFFWRFFVLKIKEPNILSVTLEAVIPQFDEVGAKLKLVAIWDHQRLASAENSVSESRALLFFVDSKQHEPHITYQTMIALRSFVLAALFCARCTSLIKIVRRRFAHQF